MEVDWAEMNADILRQIANKVGDIANFIRLRAVCKHWRSVVHPSDQPPQLPWFLHLKPDFTGNSARALKAFSIYSNKTYNLPWSRVDFVTNSFSSSGYLYKSDFRSIIMLFNPITGVHVPFPYPLDSSTLNNFDLTDVSSTCNPHLNKHGINVMFINRGMSPDLRWSGIYTSLWRYCEQTWIRIFQVFSPVDVKLRTFCNGKLYTVNDADSTEMNVIDVATSKVVSVIQNPPHVFFHYLIDACGDLLGIQYTASNIYGQSELEIYRLDDTSGNPFWTELIEGIGDRILFLSSPYLKAIGFCLEASCFAGLRSNCIYMNDIYENQSGGWHESLKRFDLSKCNSEILLDGNFNCVSTWFVPSLC